MAFIDTELIPLPEDYTPIHLETERLLLDSVTEEDAVPLWRCTLGDPEVMKYIGTISPDIEHARGRVINVMNVERKVGFSVLTVRLKQTGEVIGTCGLIPVERTGPEIELGYHTAKAHWRKGYTSEAAVECLRWGFEDLGLDRVIAICDEPNVGSWKVMEKIGMQRVGLTKQYYDVETLLYDLTLDQWRSGI